MSEAPVPPSAIVISEIPEIEPPVINTFPASCVAIPPSPRDARASGPDSTTQLLPSDIIKFPFS